MWKMLHNSGNSVPPCLHHWVSLCLFFTTHGVASLSVLLKTLGLFEKSTAQCSSSAGASLSLKSGLLLRDAVSVIDRQGLSLCVSSHESDTTRGLLQSRHRSGAALQEIRMRLIVYQTQSRVLVSQNSVFPNFLSLFSFQLFNGPVTQKKKKNLLFDFTAEATCHTSKMPVQHI